MKNSKRAGVVSATAATLLVGGVAFAAWTSTGTGTGSVTAGSEQGLTVEQVAPVTGLYPTGTKDFELVVTNGNPYAVEITSLVKTVDGGSDNLGDCDVTFNEKAILSDVVAAGDTKTYTLTASMGDNPAQDCQNQAFSYAYVATADSDTDNS